MHFSLLKIVFSKKILSLSTEKTRILAVSSWLNRHESLTDKDQPNPFIAADSMM
jgi:hypothetical protein